MNEKILMIFGYLDDMIIDIFGEVNLVVLKVF